MVTVPFEYAAEVLLTGTPGEVHEAAIGIAPDGSFVATAISYGFEPEAWEALTPDLTPAQMAAPSLSPAALTLLQIPERDLLDGFRVNPRVAPLVFDQTRSRFLNELIARERFASGAPGQAPAPPLDSPIFQRLRSADPIGFFLSMVDSASGRELQDAPTFSISSLGRSDGERPFRLLAQPVSFLPRSTIRVQVIEQSERTRGTLFIVMHGYATLHASDCDEPAARAALAAARAGGVVLGDSRRIVPFDYSLMVPLRGEPGRVDETEVNVSTDGAFVATALGYGIDVGDSRVALGQELQRLNLVNAGVVDLNQMPLGAIPPRALLDGVRMRPAYRRLVFGAGGIGALPFVDNLRADLADEIFESVNRPEAVSFRYSIFESSVGRELSNRAIGMLAGWGIANGDRPFKRFARPLVVSPRARLRLRVEEREGRGSLYVALQGYKLVGRN